MKEKQRDGETKNQIKLSHNLLTDTNNDTLHAIIYHLAFLFIFPFLRSLSLSLLCGYYKLFAYLSLRQIIWHWCDKGELVVDS